MNTGLEETTASLADWLTGSPYVSYSYAYPHKTAYRPFDPPRPLADVWRSEPREPAYLYLHVPFCEYRCGFCNLFTQSNPATDLPSRYLDQLRVEAERFRRAAGDFGFARLGIGGGTPTYLSIAELSSLFGIARDVLQVDSTSLPVAIECSPATIDVDKLVFLREVGVDRVSIGVQTFDDAESRGLGRPQKRTEVDRALAALRDVDFPTLNIDLVFGGEGQTVAGFTRSVRAALEWSPEELFLYPLYVRPLTGLGRRDRDWDDHRLEAYRAGRDLLLEAGYEQVSLRMFRRCDAPVVDGPPYRCTEDGMVGLGCGARSYARRLHYSGDYAVEQRGVRAILNDYLERDPGDFDVARIGIQLDDEDERRRFVILSLLQADGLDRAEYVDRFGSDPMVDLPELDQLEPLELATVDPRRIVLTKAGLERSDTIGPWLYSRRTRRLSEEYECR